MTDFPATARCVVIGAGIVGNCLVGHLSDMGWDDIVLIDKGPLPNPGGSTGHASNFIFPVDHSKEIVDLTLESQRQYGELGMQNTCGGVEVARSEERMEEFRRRMTSSKCWGIESSLMTPAEVKQLVPFINEDVILGGFYTPSVSAVDSLETGTQMRRRAQDAGHLKVLANTEVLDIETIETSHGKAISAVVTEDGTISCETVVIASGVWSPKLAAMAGATIPLTPAVHQMADVVAMRHPTDRSVVPGREDRLVAHNDRADMLTVACRALGRLFGDVHEVGVPVNSRHLWGPSGPLD